MKTIVQTILKIITKDTRYVALFVNQNFLCFQNLHHWKSLISERHI